MYKILCVIIVLLLIFGLLGCDSNKENDFSNPLIKHHLKLADSFDVSSYATQYFEDVIMSIEQKDKDMLKNLFAESIREDNHGLDDDIEYIFDFINGPITYKSKINGPLTESGVDYGDKHSVISCFFDVSTDEEQYLIFLKICNEDSENERNIGLQMLQVIKQEDKDQLFDWGRKNSDCKGIFRPAT